MKKVIYFILISLAMLTSCEKSMTDITTDDNGSTTTPPTSQTTVPVSLTFFDVSTEDMVTPTDSRADEEGGETSDSQSDLKKDNYFTQLSVAIFPIEGVGEEKQYYQTNSQEDFGKLTVDLPLGKYQIVALAYRGEKPVTIEGKNLVTFPDTKVTDMVAFNKSVDITSSAKTFACGMERIMTAFTLQSTDLSPKEVVAIKATFKSHCNYQYDPATGFIPNAQEYSSIVELDPDKAGETRRLTFYTLLDNTIENNVEIALDILGENEKALKHLDFKDVKLEQGKRTTYTGELFSDNAQLNFTTEVSDGNIPLSDGSMNF